jgi:hypothetical protein
MMRSPTIMRSHTICMPKVSDATASTDFHTSTSLSACRRSRLTTPADASLSPISAAAPRCAQ